MDDFIGVGVGVISSARRGTRADGRLRGDGPTEGVSKVG